VAQFEGDPRVLCEFLFPLVLHPDFLKPILQVKNFVIIRCAHLDLDIVRKALKERGIKIVGVSGTIKKAKHKFLPYDVKCKSEMK
jgi:hypothetical protein